MKNVVIFDIDGILADYRLGLLYWIRQSIPNLSQKANEHLRVDNTWIDAKTMGISFREWLGVLEMFRMSGGKQSIPVVSGAQQALHMWKQTGHEIVLLTSRPIDIYSNIYRDTVEWLRNNNLPYDLILWSKSKAEMVYKLRLHEKVVCAFDDEFRHVQDYSNLEIPTVWIDWYKTQTEDEIKGLYQCIRYNSMSEYVEESSIAGIAKRIVNKILEVPNNEQSNS